MRKKVRKVTDIVHYFDLSEDVMLEGDIALDCEAMGLNQLRDRLCVVQISDGNGHAHLVHFPEPHYEAPRLKALLSDASRTKIIHFARFDVALIQHYLGVRMESIYCTRTASRLIRTYTDKHGLKELCKELLNIDISKHQQSSYWGTASLSDEQIAYAASDVYYLHQLRDILEERLQKEGRAELAHAVMAAIPARAWLDLAGWAEIDIFSHS
ncbi:MAG: ribonuclease D [Alphaproteobacteria bacterium]|nr:MAG: ribonuclease D [Alphaproteobacteria bacterium]